MSTSIPKDKLEKFLSEARKILAADGGLTAQSKAKIQHAGNRQGLTKIQVDKAIGLLSASGGNESKEQAAFRHLVDAELKKEGILSQRLKRKLVTCAREQAHLNEARALEIISASVKSLNLTVEDDVELRRQFRAQIEEALKNGEPSREVLETLYVRANQLGYAREHVNREIHQIREDVGETKSNKALLYAGLVLVPLVLIGIVVGIRAMFGGAGEKPGEIPIVATPPPAPRPSEKSPLWWKSVGGLPDALAQLGQRFPKEKPTFEKLDAKEDFQRLSAYTGILLKMPELYQTTEARPHLKQLLAGCLAGEPAQDNAKQIENWLVSQFPKHGDVIASRDAANFPRRLWYAQAAVAALKHRQISRERRISLCKGLEDQLQESVDPEGEEKVLVDSVSAAMCKRFLKNVLVTATVDPNFALELSQELHDLSAAYLSETARRDARADLLVEALKQPATDPKLVTPLLAGRFATFDVKLKKVVVSAYRSAPSNLADPIETFLIEGMLVSIKPGMTQTQKADAMLAALIRKDRFLNLAAQSLNALSAQPDQFGPILQETLNLAHAATLGCALAQQADGQVQFDKLIAKPPVIGAEKKVVEEPKEAAAVPAAAAQPNQTFAQREHAFQDWKRKAAIAQILRELQQLNWSVPAFQQFANLTDSHLNVKLSKSLAVYILEYTNKDEYDTKVQSLRTSKLKDSRELKLAIVDYLGGKAELSQKPVETVFSALLGKDIEFEHKKNWREEGRKVMLRHVIESLKTSVSPDEAAQKLRELYLQQGRLLRMDDTGFAEMPDCSRVLESVIKHLANQLQTRELSEKDKGTLADVPHRLLVVEHLAEGDLQKTVLLQRQWLRLLAIYVSLLEPDCAEQARSIPGQVLAADGNVNHILAQLRNGEAGGLRLWELLHKAD